MSESSLVSDRQAAAEADAASDARDATGIGGAVIAAAPCTTTDAPVPTSGADRFMRRLLLIREPDPTIGDDKVNRLFETSILISAIRCTLAYVVFPIFAPALYAASSLGPLIGLVIGLIALVFNVAGMRRFWKSNHRMRWTMTWVYAAVMVLVTALVVIDIGHLLS